MSSADYISVREWRRKAAAMSAASGAHFEIKIDNVVRTHRDVRDSAIEAARFLQQLNLGAKIVITDLRAGSDIPHDRLA